MELVKEQSLDITISHENHSSLGFLPCEGGGKTGNIGFLTIWLLSISAIMMAAKDAAAEITPPVAGSSNKAFPDFIRKCQLLTATSVVKEK